MNHSDRTEQTDVHFHDSVDRDQAAARSRYHKLSPRSKSELGNMAGSGRLPSSVDGSIHSITRSIMVATSSVVDGLPDEQKTSPVRRVFCLLCLFDLICILILWVIYVRIINDNINAGFRDQVVNFKIESSMFDLMLLAFFRLVVQEVAYGILMAQKPWWTALTTTVTCIYLLVKIFFYDFKHSTYNRRSSNAMDYLLMLSSFVICWVETWVLDFRVLPREKAARQLTEETASLIESHSAPSDRRYQTFGRERFFSPTSSTPAASSQYGTAFPTAHQSFAGSPANTSVTNYAEVSNGPDLIVFDNEEEETPAETYPPPHEIEPLLLKASETFDQACSLFSDGHDWTHEKGDAIQGTVYSRQLERKTRIYKVEILLPIAPQRLFLDFVDNIEETPTWNPSLVEMRRVQKLSSEVDVVYSISTEQLKGVVSPRDCVNIRKWSQISRRLFLIGEQSVEHSACPSDRRYVRATNGIGFMAFEEVSGMPGQCKFTWVLNTDIKGWLPTSVVEQTMTTVMFSYLDIIRQRVDQILGVS